MQGSLPEVKEVRLTKRMTDDPVKLIADDGLSFEMEKVFATMAAQSGDNSVPAMKADRILEINPDNRIWTVLRTAWASDHDRVKEIAEICMNGPFP